MLLPCDNEVFADKGDGSRISIDEEELDALATYLEAVQVFLHQHIHSRKATLLRRRAGGASGKWRHARCTHSAEPSIIDIIPPLASCPPFSVRDRQLAHFCSEHTTSLLLRTACAFAAPAPTAEGPRSPAPPGPRRATGRVIGAFGGAGEALSWGKKAKLDSV